MAHAFSLQSIKEMETHIDKHIALLCENLDAFAKTGEIFDLKELIAFYVVDMLGELAFSQSFQAQIEKSVEKLPLINDHIYLACLMGQFPEMLPLLKKVATWTPWPWLQGLFAARQKLKTLTANCVARHLAEKVTDRKDLLTCLINAVDPETGAKMSELDINTEAFAMVSVSEVLLVVCAV